MLEPLYKKLQVLFICGMAGILSVTIGIMLNHNIAAEQRNDLSYVQRIATLIIYQLENDRDHFKETVKDYENSDTLYLHVTDGTGQLFYQSETSFPTPAEYLLAFCNARDYADILTWPDESSVTDQSGPFELPGKQNDAYWGIPARVVSKDNSVYYLTLLYRTRSSAELLFRLAPLYVLIWGLSLVCVVSLSRFILKQAFRPSVQALKKQKEFIAAASHELKSPLAVLLANVEKLGRSDRLPWELQKSAKVMDRECQRMARLVNDMLLLASSDANARIAVKKEINLDTLLISLYENYETICAGRRIPLELKLCDQSYPAVSSDPDLIRQILSIFLDNAISHAGPGVRIQIRTSLNGKTLTFYIADHGPGVPDSEKSRIFDRFYCGDRSHTDKSHVGLGLSIAKELTALLHGKIGLTDTPGGGATFYLTIPVK